MQINAYAKKTNLSAKTIRYYEEVGLLPPPKRQDNGYRDYDSHDISGARFVVGARGLDFPSMISRRSWPCVNGVKRLAGLCWTCCWKRPMKSANESRIFSAWRLSYANFTALAKPFQLMALTAKSASVIWSAKGRQCRNPLLGGKSAH